jgi:5-methylcytosine-specific restriction protein A
MLDESNVSQFLENLPPFLYPIKAIESKPGRLPDLEWQVLRRFIIRRDDNTCKRCGNRDGLKHIDHIVPLAEQGTNRRDNLETLCLNCHKAKHPWLV